MLKNESRNGCMCTFVYCGHAFGETCRNPSIAIVTISIRTENSRRMPSMEVPMCQSCLSNFKNSLPGVFFSKLPLRNVG